MTSSEFLEYEQFKKPGREDVSQQMPAESGEYSSFPRKNYRSGSRWYRNHGPLGAWYFDGSREGRYNLFSPNGTLYLAKTAEGAFREWVGPGVDLASHRRGIHESLLRDRWVSYLTLPVAVNLADVSSSDALWWGILPRLWCSPPYDTPQAFAATFFGARFDGLYTPLQYTHSQRGIAVFGEEGPRDWEEDSDKVPVAVLAQDLKIPVWSAPRASEMEWR